MKNAGSRSKDREVFEVNSAPVRAGQVLFQRASGSVFRQITYVLSVFMRIHVRRAVFLFCVCIVHVSLLFAEDPEWAEPQWVAFVPCQRTVEDPQGSYTLAIVSTHAVSGDKQECNRVVATTQSQYEVSGWTCGIGPVKAICSEGEALKRTLVRKRAGTKERYTYLKYVDQQGRFSSIDFISSVDPLESCEGFASAMSSYGISANCISHKS